MESTGLVTLPLECEAAAEDLGALAAVDTFDNADDYVAALTRLAGLVEGVELQAMVVDGDDVVVLHDLITPMGRAPVAEWFRVRGDRIGAVQVYFDARPFAPPA